MQSPFRLLILSVCLVWVSVSQAQDAPYVVAPVPAASLVSGGNSATIDLSPFFALQNVDGPIVHFGFSVTDLWAMLTPATTPLTVANFRSYMTSGRYDGTFLHRAVPDFVIQGGGFSYDGTNYNAVATYAPVPNEFYFANNAGTIAMAKLPDDINSATCEWYFNLVDNPHLDAVDKKFTVFGRLIGNGLATAKQIGALKTLNLNPIDPQTNLPVEGALETVPVVTQNAIDYFVTLQKVEEVPLLKLSNTLPGYLGISVTSSNGAAITPALTPAGLKLTSGSAGVSTISVLVTDPYGQTATTSFTATSVAIYYRVQLAANPTSRGTVSGAGNYVKGSLRNVKAIPKKSCVFKYWTQGGKIVSYKAVYAVSVNANKALVANFR